MLVNLRSRLNQISQDVHQMTKVSQLLDYLHRSALSKIAFGLLFILSLMPAVVWIFGWAWPGTSFMEKALRQIALQANWKIVILQVGYIGCLIAAILAAKSLIAAKRAQRSAFKYLGDHALPFFLILLLIWSSISTFLSSDRELSLHGTYYRKEGLLNYFAYAGIFCLGLMVRESRQARKLLVTQVLGSMVISAAFLLNYIPEIRWTVPKLNTAVFYQINHFGYYLVLAIVASLVLMMTEPKGSRLIWVWTVSYGMAVATLILNTSLGSYLAVMGALGLSMIFYHRIDGTSLRRRIFLANGFIWSLVYRFRSFHRALGQ